MAPAKRKTAARTMATKKKATTTAAPKRKTAAKTATKAARTAVSKASSSSAAAAKKVTAAAAATAKKSKTTVSKKKAVAIETSDNDEDDDEDEDDSSEEAAVVEEAEQVHNEPEEVMEDLDDKEEEEEEEEDLQDSRTAALADPAAILKSLPASREFPRVPPVRYVVDPAFSAAGKKIGGGMANSRRRVWTSNHGRDWTGKLGAGLESDGHGIRPIAGFGSGPANRIGTVGKKGGMSAAARAAADLHARWASNPPGSGTATAVTTAVGRGGGRAGGSLGQAHTYRNSAARTQTRTQYASYRGRADDGMEDDDDDDDDDDEIPDDLPDSPTRHVLPKDYPQSEKDALLAGEIPESRLVEAIQMLFQLGKTHPSKMTVDQAKRAKASGFAIDDINQVRFADQLPQHLVAAASCALLGGRTGDPEARMTSTHRAAVLAGKDPNAMREVFGPIIEDPERNNAEGAVIEYSKDFVLLRDKMPKSMLHWLILPRDREMNRLFGADPIGCFTKRENRAFLEKCKREVERVKIMAGRELYRLVRRERRRQELRRQFRGKGKSKGQAKGTVKGETEFDGKGKAKGKGKGKGKGKSRGKVPTLKGPTTSIQKATMAIYNTLRGSQDVDMEEDDEDEDEDEFYDDDLEADQEGDEDEDEEAEEDYYDDEYDSRLYNDADEADDEFDINIPSNAIPWPTLIRSGIHAGPSMHHLHIHIISVDRISDSMLRASHYNSFNTTFFVDLDEFPLAGKDVRRTNEGRAKLLGTNPVTCWRCRARFDSTPGREDGWEMFKKHLVECAGDLWEEMAGSGWAGV